MRTGTKLPLVAAATVALGMVAAQGHAAIVTWNFDNVTGASPPTVTSAPASGGSVSNLTVGSFSGVGDLLSQTGVFNNASSNTYPGATGANDFGMYAAPGSIVPGATDYVQVTFTPDSGYVFQLSDVDFGARSTSTGPKNYAVRWSVDGYASDILAAAIDNSGSTWKFYNSSFSPVTDPTSEPVTVRLYMYGGTGNPGSSANFRMDDVSFDVAALPVPEPASAALLGLAGLPWVAGRRRRA